MIANTDIALMTTRDVAARLTEESGCIAFFVDDDEDFFLLSEIFCYRLGHEFTKITFLTSHIDEIDIFLLLRMGEVFVVH